jgi:hypothetical protein
MAAQIAAIDISGVEYAMKAIRQRIINIFLFRFQLYIRL